MRVEQAHDHQLFELHRQEAGWVKRIDSALTHVVSLALGVVGLALLLGAISTVLGVMQLSVAFDSPVLWNASASGVAIGAVVLLASLAFQTLLPTLVGGTTRIKVGATWLQLGDAPRLSYDDVVDIAGDEDGLAVRTRTAERLVGGDATMLTPILSCAWRQFHEASPPDVDPAQMQERLRALGRQARPH